MKSDKGITLITLVITIVVLLILSGVATYQGTRTLEFSRALKFATELQIIQQEVNKIYEENKENLSNINLGTSVDTTNQNIVKAHKAASTTNINKFRYFNAESILSAFGIEDIKQEIIVCFETREVISVTGINYNRETYYTQNELPMNTFNVENTTTTTSEITYDIDKKNYGLYTKLEIENINTKNVRNKL